MGASRLVIFNLATYVDTFNEKNGFCQPFDGSFQVKIKLLTREIDFDISGLIDKRVFRVLVWRKIINEKGG